MPHSGSAMPPYLALFTSCIKSLIGFTLLNMRNNGKDGWEYHFKRSDFRKKIPNLRSRDTNRRFGNTEQGIP